MNKDRKSSNNFSKTFRTNSNSKSTQSAFTIVELLVVIVIIGILATITIVSYTGITAKANASALQSDLTNASKKLTMYYTEHGFYPSTIDATTKCPKDSLNNPDTNYCIKPSSSSTVLVYNLNTMVTPNTYSLTATNSNLTYGVGSNSPPVSMNTNITCPSGFIKVPGSPTYGTNSFCVMKYIASQVGATTTPISTSGTLPWVNISQTTAIANSPNVAGCTGCHLITEAEWLTIAQNVLSVASNWDNGAGVHTVGTGYIYSGHNDNAPASAQAAGTDNDGYVGTGGNVAPSNQRRTLTLTNGEVIWDLAGNVWQWTAGQSTTGQPGNTGNAYASWIQWPSVAITGSLSPSPFPATTGITGSNTWTGTNGIGQLLSNPAEAGLRGFLRGGNWIIGSIAGVLALNLNYAPSNTFSAVGFRVASPAP